jgi:hypothetical protein
MIHCAKVVVRASVGHQEGLAPGGEVVGPMTGKVEDATICVRPVVTAGQYRDAGQALPSTDSSQLLLED